MKKFKKDMFLWIFGARKIIPIPGLWDPIPKPSLIPLKNPRSIISITKKSEVTKNFNAQIDPLVPNAPLVARFPLKTSFFHLWDFFLIVRNFQDSQDEFFRDIS